jgi:hypothetical protein
MIAMAPKCDQSWGHRCLSYQVQFPLSEAARLALAKVSEQLDREAPSAFWRSPPETLHVTCHSLVSPRDTYDKEKYWGQISPQAVACMGLLASQIRGFSLRFCRVKVTDQAIVAIAEDQPSVCEARAIFAGLIPPPPVEPAKINIIHATLCRYRDPARIPPDLLRRSARIRLDICSTIGAAVLVRELRYPSLETEIVVAEVLS